MDEYLPVFSELRDLCFASKLVEREMRGESLVFNVVVVVPGVVD